MRNSCSLDLPLLKSEDSQRYQYILCSGVLGRCKADFLRVGIWPLKKIRLKQGATTHRVVAFDVSRIVRDSHPLLLPRVSV